MVFGNIGRTVKYASVHGQIRVGARSNTRLGRGRFLGVFWWLRESWEKAGQEFAHMVHCPSARLL